MKAVILAGGFGTRISEETGLRPKPMIEIGHQPIIWHIMKIYSHYGVSDFIICCGYKGYQIKEFFLNYRYHLSDITINFENNDINIHNVAHEPWKVTLVDTGLETMTGGRIKRIRKYLDPDENFFLTYGDGLADIDIDTLLNRHNQTRNLVTVTAVEPPGRFGVLRTKGDKVEDFGEKIDGSNKLINGGFFVVNERAIEFIRNDETVWEEEPMKGLAECGELGFYKHMGFWQPMDTLRDKNKLENLWQSGSAPWKVWR